LLGFWNGLFPSSTRGPQSIRPSVLQNSKTSLNRQCLQKTAAPLVRPEKGLFCLLFVAAWTKSKSAGGRNPPTLQVFSNSIQWILRASRENPRSTFSGNRQIKKTACRKKRQANHSMERYPHQIGSYPSPPFPPSRHGITSPPLAAPLRQRSVPSALDCMAWHCRW